MCAVIIILNDQIKSTSRNLFRKLMLTIKVIQVNEAKCVKTFNQKRCALFAMRCNAMRLSHALLSYNIIIENHHSVVCVCSAMILNISNSDINDYSCKPYNWPRTHLEFY